MFCLIIGLSGCVKQTSDINHTLGGWLGNEDENNSSNEHQNNSQNSGENIEEITFNTDPMLSGISVEIEEYFGKHIIFKVTNNSNNCYRFLSITVYFKCMPLLGRPLLEEDEEYDQGYVFMNIPAYSTTYFLEDALGEMMSVDKGANVDGIVYYDFNPKEDEYRIELTGSDDPWSPSVRSKDLIQNAHDYIVFDRNTYND